MKKKQKRKKRKGFEITVSIAWDIFKKICLLLVCLSLPISGFCSSPRLLITLGSKCDFSLKYLRNKIGGTIVTGTEEEIGEKILYLDRTKTDHIILLPREMDNMYWFCRRLGYAHLHLNERFKKALKIIDETIATIPLTDADLPRMKPEEVGLFYDLLIKIDRIFKENNLCYWATCGTLLGILRHQGMVPWDTDVDLAIFESDVERFLALQSALSDAGLELCYNSKFEFYKICFKNGQPILKEDGTCYPWTYPFVDIFPLTHVDEKYTYSGEIWQKQWKHRDYFSPDDLLAPLPEMAFGPLLIPVPRNPIDYVLRMYDEDWNDVAYVHYAHQSEQYLTKIRVDLLDRSPPVYVLP